MDPSASYRLSSDLQPLIVGTAQLGNVVSFWGPKPKVWFRYLDEVLDSGLRTFDLAASYQLGATESLFGAWLKTRPDRNDVRLITKGGHPLPLLAPHRLSARPLRADLESSLKRLGGSRIWLYLLHRDDHHTPLSAVAETMSRFSDSGDIGAWGVSNWHHERVRELMVVCERAGVPPPQVSSPHCSLFSWERPPYPGCISIANDAEAIRFYAAQRMPVLAWSPFCGGYLFSANGEGTVYDSARNRERKARLHHWARSRGIDPAVALLRYVVSLDAKVVPVVASREPRRLAHYLLESGQKMSAQDRAMIEDPA